MTTLQVFLNKTFTHKLSAVGVRLYVTFNYIIPFSHAEIIGPLFLNIRCKASFFLDTFFSVSATEKCSIEHLNGMNKNMYSDIPVVNGKKKSEIFLDLCK
jgi:hypothetical protein